MTVALVTGCTGTFGQALLEAQPDWTIRAYSRDEHKQAELQEKYPDVRWLLGDVRDPERLRRAMEGADTVIHAAALKHVTAGEYNPDEFIKTNILGTLNVVEACHAASVERAVLLSSDKAVHPVNLYGATKLCAEKLFLTAGSIARTRFSVVRYGNVRGSRGSVHTRTRPTLTDARATRFWMDPREAVALVLLALQEMQGGEVFVPKLESGRVDAVLENWADLAETGLRPGEKLHEMLIAPEEVAHTAEYEDHYRIFPSRLPLRQLPADFTYTSG